MAYPERLAKWIKRADGNACKTPHYSEQKGVHFCDRREPLHAHHIFPSGVIISQGGNPDNAPGMAVCKRCHVRNVGDTPLEQDFCFHPDIDEAYSGYHEREKQRLHLEVIHGRRVTRREFPSTFDDVIEEHKKKAADGERYHSGDELFDAYLAQEAQDRQWRYHITHPDDPRPTIRHRQVVRVRTNWEWTRGLYDDERD